MLLLRRSYCCLGVPYTLARNPAAVDSLLLRRVPRLQAGHAALVELGVDDGQQAAQHRVVLRHAHHLLPAHLTHLRKRCEALKRGADCCTQAQAR